MNYFRQLNVSLYSSWSIGKLFLLPIFFLFSISINGQCITEIQLSYSLQAETHEIYEFLNKQGFSVTYTDSIIRTVDNIPMKGSKTEYEKRQWSYESGYYLSEKFVFFQSFIDPNLTIVEFATNNIDCFDDYYKKASEKYKIEPIPQRKSENVSTQEWKYDKRYKLNNAEVRMGSSYEEVNGNTSVISCIMLFDAAKFSTLKKLTKDYYETANDLYQNNRFLAALKHLKYGKNSADSLKTQSKLNLYSLDSSEIFYETIKGNMEKYVMNKLSKNLKLAQQKSYSTSLVSPWIANTDYYDSCSNVINHYYNSEHITPFFKNKLEKYKREVRGRLTFLDSRETEVFSLNDLSPGIEEKINSFIKETIISNNNSGKINSEFKWETKYSGMNISATTGIDAENPYNYEIENYIKSLGPIKKNGFFVNTSGYLKFDYQWESKIVVVKKEESDIYGTSQKTVEIKYGSTEYGKKLAKTRPFVQWMEDPYRYDGRYKFLVKKIKNNRNLQTGLTIDFIGFNNAILGKAIARTLMIPSIKSMQSTAYASTFDVAALGFWTMAGVAVTCEIISIWNYDKFLQGDVQAGQTANDFRRYSLISAGISALSYTGGTLWSLGKTKVNRQNKKYINSKFKGKQIYSNL